MLIWIKHIIYFMLVYTSMDFPSIFITVSWHQSVSWCLVWKCMSSDCSVCSCKHSLLYKCLGTENFQQYSIIFCLTHIKCIAICAFYLINSVNINSWKFCPDIYFINCAVGKCTSIWNVECKTYYFEANVFSKIATDNIAHLVETILKYDLFSFINGYF